MTVKVLPRYTKAKYTSRRHTKGVTFIKGKAYTVHGFYSEMSSTTRDGMSYVILVNEYRELWWVCNRHVRVVDEHGTQTNFKPSQIKVVGVINEPYRKHG